MLSGRWRRLRPDAALPVERQARRGARGLPARTRPEHPGGLRLPASCEQTHGDEQELTSGEQPMSEEHSPAMGAGPAETPARFADRVAGAILSMRSDAI